MRYSREIFPSRKAFFLFPAKHFITAEDQLEKAFNSIKSELEDQLEVFKKEGKILEADRLKRRTSYDSP
jgi:excinuclease ABC subunit B